MEKFLIYAIFIIIDLSIIYVMSKVSVKLVEYINVSLQLMIKEKEDTIKEITK